MFIFSKPNRLYAVVISMLLLIPLTSCNLMKIQDQSNIIENLAYIQGEVVVDPQVNSEKSGPMLLMLLNGSPLSPEIVYQFSPNDDGTYSFHIEPGSYWLATFLDTNKDGHYQINEPASYLGMTEGGHRPINIAENESLYLAPLVILGPIPDAQGTHLERQLPLIINNIGRTVSLKDEMFSPANASTGLWRPVDFLDNVGGGLFMLQAYDKTKIPVIYIHGINGSPRQFASLIESLDTQVYQPWVLYYPSGIRLSIIKDYMLNAINSMYDEHSFTEVYIVAHSMGGLIARSFTQRYAPLKKPVKLGMVMTINSPLYGLGSATSGVKNSPIVVPVWRDLASDGEFVENLHRHEWPKSVPYHLIFSYQRGHEGDGAVPMSSQLSLPLQQEATTTLGFEAEHTNILQREDFINWINQLMKRPPNTKHRQAVNLSVQDE